MKKWLLTLVVTILAGMTVWFLTQSPYSPFVGPDVELSELNVPERIVAGEQFRISFRATNRSNRAESGCHGFVSVVPMRGENDAASEGTIELAVAECRADTPQFHLGALSGSSVAIFATCRVREAGTFRMIYGLGCRSGRDSKWQLDHRTLIEVDEP
jgi:hypothetical protein